MNTDILCIDAIAIDESAEKNADTIITEIDGLPPEISLPAGRRFGIVDLWKIRNSYKLFRSYHSSDRFSI